VVSKGPPKLCIICTSMSLKPAQEPCKTCLTLPVGKDKFEATLPAGDLKWNAKNK